MKKSLVVSALLATLLGMGNPVLAEQASHDHGAARAGEAATISATGTVKSVDAAKGKLVIDHEPIAALNWPRMVMDFPLADKAMADQVKAGDKVQFELEESKKGSYTIILIQPITH